MTGSGFGSHLLELISDADGALFGVPGGQTLPLYAASEGSGRTHLVVRDERNAATAADAYARVTGTVGLCDATVGPGATNLVSGLAEAQASSIPVLAVVADTRRDAEHLRRRSVASQSYAQNESLAPVSKWVGRVLEPDSLADVVDQAFRIATTGRPGPVVVSIPEDVFLGEEAGRRSRTIGPADRRFPRHRPHPDPTEVEEIVALLGESERPVVVAGGGVVLTGAAPALAGLAEHHRLPVVTSLNGKGAIDERHPLSAGVVGGFGTTRGNLVVRGADLVIAVGTKQSQLGTHRWRLPGPTQTVVQVDIDGEELGRAVPLTLGVVADARAFLTVLHEALDDWKAADTPWIDAVRPVEEVTEPVDRVHPAAVADVLDELLGPEDLLVCEASLASGWAARHYRVKRSGPGMLAPRGIGGLGWAPGASLGARLGRPGGRVVALTGDGGWGYGLSETETAVRHGLDITTVVLNNSSLGWIRHAEDRMRLPRRSDFTAIDFAATAAAMGAHSARVERETGLETAIGEAVASPGPALVEVISSADVTPVVRYGVVRDSPYGPSDRGPIRRS